MTILTFIAFQGFSQNAPGSGKAIDQKNSSNTTVTTPGKFVDNNNDGICDNHQAKMNGLKGCNFIDKNGDGICDNNPDCKGKGNGNCCGTNCKKQGQGKGNCYGSGCGNRYRHGQGNQNNTSPEPQKSSEVGS